MSDTVEIAVCTDCLMLLANAEAFDAEGNEITEQVGANIQDLWGNTEITLGSVDDTEDTADEGYFSWSSCDGCGSTLGGDRYTATAWIDGCTLCRRIGHPFSEPCLP